MSSLGIDLTKFLMEREPKLLVCDIEASARTAVAVSDLLGAILATVLVKQPYNFEDAVKACFSRVLESAQKTATKADQMQPFPKQ